MIGFSQRLIDVGGAQLEVYRGGEGSVVVCGSQPHSPRPEGVEWYAEHAQVVYVMPRGHGRSSPVRDRTDMQLGTIVADLEAVRHRLGIDRWVLEGYSGGSQLALSYALRYPEALAGLIVGFSVASIASVLEDPRTIISPAHPIHRLDLEMAGLDRHGVAGSEEPRWLQPRPGFLVLAQGNRPLIVSPAADPTPHLKVHLEEIVHFDVSTRLHEIRVPTLVVCGRQDPLVPVDLAAAIQEAIPGARLLVLEHTAHGWDTADEEDVAVFRRTVKEFLKRLDR